jgi:sulfate-transporting ATPase
LWFPFSSEMREIPTTFGWSEGNYGAYIEDLKKRKGPDADQPHRIKYKKLVR